MKKVDEKYIEKLYDRIAKKDFSSDYEKHRWEGRIEGSRYEMMLKTVKMAAEKSKFKEFIELGPGPGTWTKFFLEKNPKANFTLIDISKEMLNQAKKKLAKDKKRIKFIQGNFEEKIPKNKKFDFFFSSRAIEYVPDKEKVFKKIGNLLSRGGHGMIITKTPHKIKDKIYNLIGRMIRKEHKDQITPKRMKYLLEKNGFRKIRIYPVIVEFPPSVKYNIPTLNQFLYKIFHKLKLNTFSKSLSEVYVAFFKKE